MRLAAAIVALAACAHAPAPVLDPDNVCTAPPTIAGLEWVDCQAYDGLRCCRYFDHACRTTWCRRDDGPARCEAAWFELATADCAELERARLRPHFQGAL